MTLRLLLSGGVAAYVPARLVNYIEWNYPPELRVALSGPTLPDAGSMPVGVRFALRDQNGQTLYRLHDDGKWRVVS